MTWRFWKKKTKKIPLSGRDSFAEARKLAAQDPLYAYLISRTNHRDQLFKDIELAVLGKNYVEALALAREGWGVRGR